MDVIRNCCWYFCILITEHVLKSINTGLTIFLRKLLSLSVSFPSAHFCSMGHNWTFNWDFKRSFLSCQTTRIYKKLSLSHKYLSRSVVILIHFVSLEERRRKRIERKERKSKKKRREGMGGKDNKGRMKKSLCDESVYFVSYSSYWLWAERCVYTLQCLLLHFQGLAYISVSGL